MEEIWKEVKYFEGYYVISNKGNLKSIERGIKYPDGSVRYFKGKQQTKTINKGGYIYYDLYKNQKRKRYFAHQLVYLTFFGDYDRKLDINHIDCNKQNNHVSNLELTTRSENMKHAVRNGLCKKTIEQSVFNLDKQKRMVLNLETGIFYESIKEASFYHDLNRSTLTQRLDGKLKNNTYFIKL